MGYSAGWSSQSQPNQKLVSIFGHASLAVFNKGIAGFRYRGILGCPGKLMGEKGLFN